MVGKNQLILCWLHLSDGQWFIQCMTLPPCIYVWTTGASHTLSEEGLKWQLTARKYKSSLCMLKCTVSPGQAQQTSAIYLSTQSLKENFRRCISQWLHLCNDLFTAVSHKCQSNTFSVTKHFHFNIFSLAVNDSIYCCITEVVRTFWSRWLSCQSKWSVQGYFIYKTPSIKKRQAEYPANTNQIGSDFHWQPATFDNPA